MGQKKNYKGTNNSHDYKPQKKTRVVKTGAEKTGAKQQTEDSYGCKRKTNQNPTAMKRHETECSSGCKQRHTKTQTRATRNISSKHITELYSGSKPKTHRKQTVIRTTKKTSANEKPV